VQIQTLQAAKLEKTFRIKIHRHQNCLIRRLQRKTTTSSSSLFVIKPRRQKYKRCRTSS